MGYDYDAIEDFGKAISAYPSDCNLYFSRSISKSAILDFNGEIDDIERAISLSTIDNELNNTYNDEAKQKGYNNSASFFRTRLTMAKMNLDS